MKWHKIPGYTDYAVNKAGTVKNIKTGKILTQTAYYSDVISVNLYPMNPVTGKKENRYESVWRLMMKTFKPDKYNKHTSTVKHRDGDPTNNALINLILIDKADQVKMLNFMRRKAELTLDDIFLTTDGKWNYKNLVDNEFETILSHRERPAVKMAATRYNAHQGDFTKEHLKELQAEVLERYPIVKSIGFNYKDSKNYLF